MHLFSRDFEAEHKHRIMLRSAGLIASRGLRGEPPRSREHHEARHEDQRSSTVHDVSRHSRRRRQSFAVRRQCTLFGCFSRVVFTVLLTCRECRECAQLDRVAKSFIFAPWYRIRSIEFVGDD